MNFKELLGKQMLFFDGATGTQLQARGLQPGELPESWNFTHPDIVEAVHRSYLDVGSNIVKSNTFGANPLKLGRLRPGLQGNHRSGCGDCQEGLRWQGK